MGNSVDSREQIIEAVQERNFSSREAAITFQVGHATVARYVHRGKLMPDKPSGRSSQIAGEQLGALKKQQQPFERQPQKNKTFFSQ